MVFSKVVFPLISFSYIFQAELWAIIKAPGYANFFSWNFIWFESDSTLVVQLLWDMSLNMPWRFLSDWSNVLKFIYSISFCLSHIYREGNMVANVLSKVALSAYEDAWSFHLPGRCVYHHMVDLWEDRTSLFVYFSFLCLLVRSLYYWYSFSLWRFSLSGILFIGF